MKITEYPKVDSLTADNVFVVDGEAGTNIIKADELIPAVLDLLSPINHRLIFRGKNLGSSLSTAQKEAIQDGTFKGLWLGDYWEVGGIKWRIADFDYWYKTGDNNIPQHHLVIMPDTVLYTAAMNSTNVTTGGYVGSAMYTTRLAAAKSTISSVFGSAVISRRNYFTNATTGDYPSAGEWYDTSVELPNEPMIYGSYVNVESGVSVKRYTIDKTQLALMAVSPTFINTTQAYWLRDVVSDTNFANVGYYGSATSGNATVENGVRPVFAIG